MQVPVPVHAARCPLSIPTAWKNGRSSGAGGALRCGTRSDGVPTAIARMAIGSSVDLERGQV